MSNSYLDVMSRRNKIILDSLKLDYSKYEYKGIGFDYEKMMSDTGFSSEEVKKIQLENRVGNTPLVELANLTNYARKFAKKGYGAKIILKDEANNLSGSFKARRAAISVYQAKKLGYKGVIAATSGNYGAAVAAMAARLGLKCIIVQETYDSNGVGQPEIIEKARACEAYGAEVIRLTVGPELFYQFLLLLEQTGYFNASLYSPYGIQGIETLGEEIIEQCLEKYNKHPEVVVVTNAGGGNLTGTARGLLNKKAFNTKIIAASVDLSGLHMASDKDFNRKSFTTGHTGFGIPFTTFPDRSDVPRSAARPLRYLDRYLTINQGSVFFITEALAKLEGMERGPAGNVSLAVAFKLAQEMKEDEIIVVQESEYTGAGKHMNAQIDFAKNRGIKLIFGNPMDEKPGENIIFPSSAKDINYKEFPLKQLQKSYLRYFKNQELSNEDYEFLKEELKTDINTIKKLRSEERES